ncbi:extracellular solute-binding protein [Micromonospora echinofusca]|uniref:Extracellular solute-binding protein n=1 Tax=Micromonospora echinofusca TaxID=47858 RepID=A0ABS3VPR3_MICEH|nr:extracellular solute-binding protein [Micromonospora echinofusca]MBO4206522.1 extracellular solute-binding protein [Micromonospora echinofusca]
MADHYSRRSFLSGVLACGTLSAGAVYLMPGGRSLPSVELRMVSGADPTGARDLLIDLWNRANPRTMIRLVNPITSGSGDERTSMLSKARAGEADIVNLDIIDVPEFARQQLITPIPLADSLQFIEPARRVSQVPDDPDLYWAAPFNTDVGMLFRRRADERDTAGHGLARALDDGTTADAPQFVAQLQPNASTYDEAFVVNVLEHALSRDPDLIDADGTVSDDLERWQLALGPLRAAIADRRVRLSGDETDSLKIFVDDRLRYMRNWPVKYRELQQAGDPDVRTGRIQVEPLPVGILGGQSLAIVARSPHVDRAREFIGFLTDDPAQKILAAHGLAPTRISAYGDANLRAVIPHLLRVREAVEAARPRPVHPNYRTFAKLVRDHANALLHDGRELTPEFVVEIRRTLS